MNLARSVRDLATVSYLVGLVAGCLSPAQKVQKAQKTPTAPTVLAKLDKTPPLPSKPALHVELLGGHGWATDLTFVGVVATPHYIVSAGSDNTVCAWDVAERICKARIRIDAQPSGLTASKTEDAVLIGTYGGYVYRWDLSAKAPVELPTFASSIAKFSASADLNVWVENYTNKIRVFEAKGKLLREMEFPEKDPILSIAMAPDGQRFAIKFNHHIRIEPTRDSRTIFDIKAPPGPRQKNPDLKKRSYDAIAWDDTGKKLAACAPPKMEIWSVEGRKVSREHEIPVADGYCNPVAWSKDGAGVVFTSALLLKRGLYVEPAKKKASEPAPTNVQALDSNGRAIVFTPEGQLAVVGDYADIQLHQYPSLARVGQLRTRDPSVMGLAWDAEGQRLAWFTPTRRLFVLNTQKTNLDIARPWYEVRTGSELQGDVALLFAGEERLFIGRVKADMGQDPRTGAILDLRSGAVLGRLDASYWAFGTTPDGLYLGTKKVQAPSVFRIDMQDGQARVNMQYEAQESSWLGEKTVIAPDGSGRAVFFPGKGFPQLQTFTGANPPNIVELVNAGNAAALRGSLIVTGSSQEPKQLLLWDAAGKKNVPVTIDCVPKRLALSADVRYLAVGCAEGLRVLALDNKQELVRDPDLVGPLVFHPRLPVLAVGGYQLRLYRLDRGVGEDQRLDVHVVDRRDEVYPVIVSKTAVDAPDAAEPTLVIHEVDSKRARPLSDVRVNGLLARFLEKTP